MTSAEIGTTSKGRTERAPFRTDKSTQAATAKRIRKVRNSELAAYEAKPYAYPAPRGPGEKWGTMNFEVNGVRYFLTFGVEEGEWLLLTPTKNGLRRLRIHNDGAPVIPLVDIDFEPGDHDSLS